MCCHCWQLTIVTTDNCCCRVINQDVSYTKFPVCCVCSSPFLFVCLGWSQTLQSPSPICIHMYTQRHSVGLRQSTTLPRDIVMILMLSAWCGYKLEEHAAAWVNLLLICILGTTEHFKYFCCKHKSEKLYHYCTNCLASWQYIQSCWQWACDVS